MGLIKQDRRRRHDEKLKAEGRCLVCGLDKGTSPFKLYCCRDGIKMRNKRRKVLHVIPYVLGKKGRKPYEC